MTYTAKRIAAMLRANVRAVDTGRITFDQFHAVQRATWNLANRGEMCIIGSQASRRVASVQRELRMAA